TSINSHKYGQNHLILAGKGERPAILGAGGAEGIPTHEPHNAIVVLYQLSYNPNQTRGGTLVSRPGLSKHFARIPRRLTSPPCASPQAKIAATNCVQFHGLPSKLAHAKTPVATGHRSKRRSAKGQTRRGSAQSHDRSRVFEGSVGGTGAHPGRPVQRIAGAGGTAAQASRLAPAVARHKGAAAPAPRTGASSRGQFLAPALARSARLLLRPGETETVQATRNAAPGRAR